MGRTTWERVTSPPGIRNWPLAHTTSAQAAIKTIKKATSTAAFKPGTAGSTSLGRKHHLLSLRSRLGPWAHSPPLAGHLYPYRCLQQPLCARAATKTIIIRRFCAARQALCEARWPALTHLPRQLRLLPRPFL